MRKSETVELLDIFLQTEGRPAELFIKACESAQALRIYICLDADNLNKIISKIKKRTTGKELYEKLVDKQPSINVSLETYDNVVEQVRKDMDQYFKFNGYKMANAIESQEGWIQHFYMKYYYFVNFYRIRWFFPEQLTKKTKVRKTHKKYSDFLNLARKSITEERRVQARKSAENPEASLNKTSMDGPMYNNNEKITLLDVTINDEQTDDLESQQETKCYIKKILEMSDNFEDGKYTKKLKAMLERGDCKGKSFELVLLKIFAYKAGIVTAKSVKFISGLSRMYKDKFGISNALLEKQMKQLGLKK
jgi:hypothetical protein